MSIYKITRTFLWNLRDFFRFSLKEAYKNSQNLQRQGSQALDYELLIETILYEVPNSGIRRPKILSADETIDEILHTNKSIARFGDGEIMVANGEDIGFQRAEPELSRRLREILAKPQENLMVTLSGYLGNPSSIVGEKNRAYKDFALYAVPNLRRKTAKFINYDTIYYNTSASGARFEDYRSFFVGKKLVLVGCKEAFESYEFNIFDTAAVLKYEFVPNKHCFSEYESILSRLKAYEKDFLIILMCGPTACVLASDLCAEGFRALDLGHLAKAYDWKMRGIDTASNAQNSIKFFAPDEREK